MNFNSTAEIKKAGFIGFRKMDELFEDSSAIPKIRGVYLVLNPITSTTPAFLTKGTGGFFKGKDPNVSMPELKDNWVENTIVVYIGMAGKQDSKATLHSRLKQYFHFGQGKNVGHWGGRLIWQLKSSLELVVCWKALPTEDPLDFEGKLIQKFKTKFNKRPFANLKD